MELTRENGRGIAVDFYDARGRRYDALVTEVWGPQCVNVVYVNDVEGQQDRYGQKLMRATSIMHGSLHQAHGYFWLAKGEERPKHTLPGYYDHPDDQAAAEDSALA